jgi:hypothetical protein
VKTSPASAVSKVSMSPPARISVRRQSKTAESRAASVASGVPSIALPGVVCGRM